MIKGPIAFRIVLRPITGDVEPAILHEGEATAMELLKLPAIDRRKIQPLLQKGVQYTAHIECSTSNGWEYFLPMDIVWPEGYIPWVEVSAKISLDSCFTSNDIPLSGDDTPRIFTFNSIPLSGADCSLPKVITPAVTYIP